MASDAKLADVAKHYDSAAGAYHELYDRERLHDLSAPYPANYFRMQIMLNAFAQAETGRVIEVGVGEGTPLATLAAAGVDVWGFDISRPMVERAKASASKAGLDPQHVFWGDVEDPNTYAAALKSGKFDGLMAMGVMPHVKNDAFVLDNMRTLVRPGGTMFVEFRNKLFSLFTFNRHTYEFILDDLLKDVDTRLKEQVALDLKARLEMDKPAARAGAAAAPGYDDIPSKFHNPFEVLDQFIDMGFESAKLHWYHYHPAPPFLADRDPGLYRQAGMALEHETSGWRGFFLCSAFVIEAVV